MDNMQNHRVLHINRLKPRSTVIPAQTENIFYHNKEKSDRIIMLNGEYDFKYGDGTWGRLTVPSMWQFHGYGVPRYTNTEYTFPFNPPYIGADNPVGYYKRSFVIEKLYPRMILHFDGVDSGFYVRVNGNDVGMSKGARLPAEFDIAEYLAVGENTIEIDVYTHCDGSYLEAQDMVLASGIFRDVYIICVGEVSIWDYVIKRGTGSVSVDITLDYECQSGYSVRTSIDGQCKSCEVTGESVGMSFDILSPKLWCDETPYLYDLKIELLKGGRVQEIHTKRVGLCEVSIKDKHIFCVNGKPVKLKGVNRHEYVPDNGRAIDYETTKKELEHIKSLNMNAIRCSHYPNAPFFYEIASELGIYVMDEADLETHGCGITGDQGYLSKAPSWADAYIDRVSRTYERDKNETCIIIWSIGNESGNGENMEKCAHYLRGVDIKKPILYPQDCDFDPKFTDFRQTGYNKVLFLDLRHAETGPWFKGGDTPIIMTEYAHAMGNGPGSLHEYWERVYKYEDFAGGFIWEYKNHGVKDGEDYLYGSDYGERLHSLNFSLDGICLSDGSEKPFANEVREVFSPVDVYYDGAVTVKNRNAVRSLSYLKVSWELLENFRVIAKGELDGLDIAPNQARALDIDIDYPELSHGKRYFVTLTFTDNGRLVSRKQVELPYRTPKAKYVPQPFPYKLEGDTVIGEDFTVGFSGGVPALIKKGDRVILNSRMKLSFYRKPTDNDGIAGKHEKVIGEWNKLQLRDFAFSPETSRVEKSESGVTFKYFGKAMAPGAYSGFNITAEYTVMAHGVMSVNIVGEPFGKMPKYLPRIGVVLELDGSYDRALWYGRGEHESYPDLKTSTVFGLFEKSVADMSFLFDRPQDSGNREDAVFAAVTDGRGCGLLAIGSDSFSFAVQDYTLDALMDAEHRGELVKSDRSYLYINYKTRGLGSASCGPHPEDYAELTPHEFEFSFILKPFEGIEDAERMSEYDFGKKCLRRSDFYSFTPIRTVRENFESRD